MKKELKVELEFLKRFFEYCIQWGTELSALELSIQKQIVNIKKINKILKEIEEKCEKDIYAPIPRITPETPEDELKYIKEWMVARVTILTERMLQDILKIK